IVSGPIKAPPGTDTDSLPSILRSPDASDLETREKNEELRAQAKDFCARRITERKLEMKLVDVEVYFDRSKLIFYFTAPSRVDFRELVKDLVREYRARIELRQIGVRHETQLKGAVGNCGRVCCCRCHLRKFAPVTIKMAKEQNLFLNPSKISGICGRLLCCLSYEQDCYENFHRSAPRPNKKYQTPEGVIKTVSIDMFKNAVTYIGPDNAEKEVSMDDWKKMNPKYIAEQDGDEKDGDRRGFVPRWVIPED
ncbi:MAG: hypothetical protein K2H64_10215, partial [Desulfovibrio sp.]|nr:hypothetical protein [Desulfovibrio sp.]